MPQTGLKLFQLLAGHLQMFSAFLNSVSQRPRYWDNCKSWDWLF